MFMPRRDLELTGEIRSRIKKWDDNWRFNKDQYHEFVSFIMGSQWTEDESKLFIDYKKIPLTFNKMAPLANNLMGEQRQNTPNLQVEPEDSVPEEVAEVREALIKEISFNSNAKLVYQIAFQCEIIGGFGAYSIDTEYENNRSTELVIVLRDHKDPTLCYWDLGAKSPCKTDGMYGGYRTRMTRKKFAQLWGKKIEAQIGADSNFDEGSATGWIFSNDDEITIIHDWRREYKKEKIYKLTNGRTIDQQAFKEMEKVKIDDVEILIDNGEPVAIVDKREIYRSLIKYTQTAGDFVLEEEDFPSENIPVIFVDQNSYWDKSGKQICRPILKDARDAQRFLNYLGTQVAYQLKTLRYDQFLVPKSAIKSPDTQNIWRDPNTAQGGLVFDDNPSGSNRPQYLPPPNISPSLIEQYNRTMMDIQSCTGIYDTKMGEMGNEISGAAIDARTRQGSYNTYVAFDSINRAIAAGGEIIDEMIPHIYKNERTMRLNMKNSGVRKISLNKPLDEYGSKIENDMTEGYYKIRLVPGASYEGQKQEVLTSIQTVLQADPQLFRLVADLYAENLPLPNTIELRNRLRTIVPPEIIEAGKTGEPIPPKKPQPSPEEMAMQQEMQLKHMEIMQNGQLKMKEIELKQKDLQLKAAQTEQDISMAWKKLETERLEAAAGLQEQELRYQAEAQRTGADLQIAHADNLVRILTHQPKENKEPKK